VIGGSGTMPGSPREERSTWPMNWRSRRGSTS
jgi:hypothetical protein